MTDKEVIEVLVLMSLQYSPRTTEYKALNEAIDKLRENLPKKGKWIRITKKSKSIQMWNCSECGRTVEKATILSPDIHFPFCHCGADMREGEEE